MKILVAFSGGKDSQASLIWACQRFKKDNIEAVFCDTGWEHEFTYKHIKEVTEKLDVKLVVLKSKKYTGFVDLVEKKKRFPSSKARFCTEELKTKPMIDYILDHKKDHLFIIQGIRADESHSRKNMDEHCSFFKYYKIPKRYDKNNKPIFYTYRKKEVLEWCKKYADDIFRPIIDWTAEDVVKYIKLHNQKLNPLYYQGYKRVGCFPCIMCTKKELTNIIDNVPDKIQQIIELEKKVGSTFFSPNYLPKWFLKEIDPISKKLITTMPDAINYVKNKYQQQGLYDKFEWFNNKKCISYYNICE